MASSLAKINQQIAKLQKQAEAIQNTVITRIKREIAQHGLTAEHLFGSASTFVGNGKSAGPTQPRSAAKAAKAGAGKPIKFADGNGNTWHGTGKRPSWVHEAVASGRSLDEFLVGSNEKPAVAANGKAKPQKASRAKKPAVLKKTSASKSPKAAKPAVTAKASPRKSTKAPATAKKVSAKKSTRKKAAPAQGADAQAPQAAA